MSRPLFILSSALYFVMTFVLHSDLFSHVTFLPYVYHKLPEAWQGVLSVVAQGMEPKALCIPGKCFTTEPHHQACHNIWYVILMMFLPSVLKTLTRIN